MSLSVRSASAGEQDKGDESSSHEAHSCAYRPRPHHHRLRHRHGNFFRCRHGHRYNPSPLYLVARTLLCAMTAWCFDRVLAVDVNSRMEKNARADLTRSLERNFAYKLVTRPSADSDDTKRHAKEEYSADADAEMRPTRRGENSGSGSDSRSRRRRRIGRKGDDHYHRHDEDRNDDPLLVCRNLHLDELIFHAPSLPGPEPYRSRFVTEEIVIGGGSGGGGGGGENKRGRSNSDDTDVTFLLANSLQGNGGGDGGGDGDGDEDENGDEDGSGKDGDSFFFDPSVTMRLRFATNYPRHVKLLRLDYTVNGAGVRIGSTPPGPALDRDNVHFVKNYTVMADSADCFTNGAGHGDGGIECFADIELLIPHDSYIDSSRAPWADMRRIAITYGLPGNEDNYVTTLSDVEVQLQLLRLCSSQPPPHFCSEPSVDIYETRGHDCNCATCHSCGCTAAPPWAADCDERNGGQCGPDQGGCWCGITCKCCSDCVGYSCRCETCFDSSSLAGCALGSTFAVKSVDPPDGIASQTNEIVLRGSRFFANAPNITCRFTPSVAHGDGAAGKEEGEADGAWSVLGGYRSPNEIFCSTPPVAMPNGTSEKFVTYLSVSLNGETYSRHNPNATFAFFDCPNGCGDINEEGNACPASSCSCPPDRYGSDCSHKCVDCDHGRCGAVSGRCMCDMGYTGSKCDLQCPGGKDDPCSGRGTCYAKKIVVEDGVGESESKAEVEEASCYCPLGYWGQVCENDCPRDENGLVCANRGTCNQRDGTCLCRDGYYGDSCSRKCPGMDEHGMACSGRGICCTGRGAAASYSQCQQAEVGSCACDAGRGGSSCEELTCFEDCYGHGMCTSNGTCVCAADYKGTFCSLQKGQDDSISYISFSDSLFSVAEEQGSLDILVMRSGNLTGDVSVHYETKDLTATQGEDYAPLSNRLQWSSMDGTAKTIKVSIMTNDWPEGQESFELTLSDPIPQDKCSVSGTVVAIVRIAAKAESYGASTPLHEKKDSVHVLAARITVRISRPWDAVKPGEVAGEEMRNALRNAAATSASIDSSRIYYKGTSDIKPTEFGRVLLTFDVLPPLGTNTGAADYKGAKEAADDFVKAVADQRSALYGHGMERLCPIDTTFVPEVHMFALDGSVNDDARSGWSVAGIVMFSLTLAAATVFIFRKREVIMERALQWLSRRKFHRIRHGATIPDLNFDERDYLEPDAADFSECAVTRFERRGLREGLKRKVLQIELT